MGDDFDEALLALCLEQIGLVPPPPGPDRDRLLEMCREEKERFTSSTRKLKPELFGDKRDAHLAVKVADYEERIRPLVQRTFDALDTAVARAQALVNLDFEKNTVVYQVGGGSQLPTVGRLLKEKFGRRVWKSPYAHASVAVGLAIAAESPAEVRVENRFTRYFGVWREADGGRNAWFDPVFPKDTPLPHAPPSQTADGDAAISPGAQRGALPLCRVFPVAHGRQSGGRNHTVGGRAVRAGWGVARPDRWTVSMSCVCRKDRTRSRSGTAATRMGTSR